MIKIARPPKDLTSFLGRKWLESLTVQGEDFSSFANLPFLVVASDPSIPNARVLGVSPSLTLSDSGGLLTIDLSATGVTAGTYNLVTVDSEGRVTAGASTATVSGVVNSDGTLSILTTLGVVTASLNLAHANTWTADQSVPDEAYGVSWNGSMEVPTKNALYDKIETIGGGGGGASLSDYTNHFLLGGM